MTVQLTLTEAASILEPPISEPQLRLIVRALAIQPSGHRRTGQAGRPTEEFDSAEIMRLHGALSPWLQPLGVRCLSQRRIRVI